MKFLKRWRIKRLTYQKIALEKRCDILQQLMKSQVKFPAYYFNRFCAAAERIAVIERKLQDAAR